MAVTNTQFFETGLYTPYYGLGPDQPAGTYERTMSAVGTATGGTVTLTLTMDTEAFGFRVLLVLTNVVILDTLATPEAVEFGYVGTGNKRIANSHGQSVLPVASESGNLATLSGSQLAIAIEPAANQVDGAVVSAIWSTNEDTKAYQALLYGLVYDMEKMTRMVNVGRPDPVFFGVS